MRSPLSKMASTIAGLSIMLVLIALGVDESGSRAEDYPTYPNKQTIYNSPCTSTQVCVVCPNPYNGTVVYGTSAARPDAGYNQGNCGTMYPGAQMDCYGTSWKCERLPCKDMIGDNPPVFQYQGNWCKQVSP